VTVAGSRSAIRGIFGPWYGPVATTTWSAVSVPAVVASSNAPDTARRSRVTRTPSASGGRTNAAYSSMYRMISARFMNPSGSGPRYGKPGRRHCQFGVTRKKLSQRRSRHSYATRSASSTMCRMPRSRRW